VLYAAFWINAVVSLRHWTRLAGKAAQVSRVEEAQRVQ